MFFEQTQIFQEGLSLGLSGLNRYFVNRSQWLLSIT